ncbi:hypothetical protein BB560_004889 [Smittium megazygosporum]|uniref:Structural maintenance of chromosomes protein n=1 Tax=Smittium megazygosporum TaxID=133381 RepID=A0A2T9Z7Z3_9FUNG|nr:hypothetical protein BB560_004889 [Smittium megazygosporum]
MVDPSHAEEGISKPKNRLVITKMVLENFKSYAGTQIIGPFHESFSAIVGPNGSGKSNVIDALLFVFGFRANKIRQGKLSELIHSSNENERYSHCSVHVHFSEISTTQETSEDEQKSENEIILSRSAFSNNSSKYYLNGKVTTLAEVTELLKRKGVDLEHKRFLILQIDNASKEVDELNDLRAEKLRRVNIIDRERKSLEPKKDEAVGFVMLENELALKKNALYQLRLYENEEANKKALTKYESIKSKFDEEEKRTFAVKEEIKTMENNYSHCLREYENLEKSVKDIQKRYTRAEREEVQTLETQKHLKNKIKKLSKVYDESNFMINTNTGAIKRAQSDIEKSQEELGILEKKLNSEKQALEEIVEDLRGKTAGLTEQLTEKQKELEPWKEKINAEKAKLSVITTEIELITSNSNNTNAQVSKVEEELMNLRKLRAEKDKAISKKVEEFALAESQIEAIKNQLDSLNLLETEFISKYHQALQSEEEAKESLNSTKSQSVVLTALLKERDLGRINGIYGRLGSLGTIDDKYDIAISTACPGLENIVVQDVTCGQQCVEFLRRNNIGRARFIMLDELPKFDLSKKASPEDSQRLFDLVKPTHPRFAPAFFHALGNTLVSKNMEQARQIAYGSQRNRVVTLDGKLIDASGTMSGGGTKITKGAMSSKPIRSDVTASKLQKLSEDRKIAESALKEFESKKAELQSNLKNLSLKYSSLESELPKAEMDLKNADELVKEFKKQLAVLQSQANNGPSLSEQEELASLKSKYTNIEKVIEKLQNECSTIEDQIKDLNNKIMLAGGVHLRTQTAKVNSITDQISLLNDNILQYEATLQKSKSELIRLQRDSERKLEEKTSLEKQLESISAVAERHKAEVEQISSQLSDAKNTIEDKKDELSSLKSKLDDRNDEINEIKTNEAKLKLEIEDSERILAECQRRRNYVNGELNRLKLESLPSGIELSEPQPESLPQLLPDALQELDPSYLEREIQKISDKLQIAKPNLSVLTEYSRRTLEFNDQNSQLNKITNDRDQALSNYNELHTQRLNTFMEGFNKISYRLKELYQLITMGGSAELELVDSLDPFVEGIIFSVMPPKKSWKNISDLSGGEKTLSSLALVFALHMYRPTPIYVMDEIDAALDFRNVSIIGNYIKQRTENAQFIVISLRNNMFELADWLVGIYKTNNKTKSITFNPAKTEKILKSTE